jgi:hypothetical protein
MQLPKWKSVVFGLFAGLIGYAGILGFTAERNGAMLCGMNLLFGNHAGSVSTTRMLTIAATLPSPAKVGSNALEIAILSPRGLVIDAAKVSIDVAMTSMDMGTNHSAVKEIGKGRYAATVTFSMAGPWRVTVNAATQGKLLESKSFDFNAI